MYDQAKHWGQTVQGIPEFGTANLETLGNLKIHIAMKKNIYPAELGLFPHVWWGNSPSHVHGGYQISLFYVPKSMKERMKKSLALVCVEVQMATYACNYPINQSNFSSELIENVSLTSSRLFYLFKIMDKYWLVCRVAPMLFLHMYVCMSVLNEPKNPPKTA